MVAPELLDPIAWCGATPERRREIVQAIASASGRELRAFDGDAEPRRYRTGGARLIHRRTGVRLCVVPAAEPFLIAEDVLTRAEVAQVAVLGEHVDWSVIVPDVDDDIMPAYLMPNGIDAAAPLRLPSDREWETAARAGTSSAFWWGDHIPPAPPSLPHPLGLVRLGWYDEATADGTVRGGAARHWPWRPEDERWRLLLCDVSRPAATGEALASRPVLSLPRGGSTPR